MTFCLQFFTMSHNIERTTRLKRGKKWTRSMWPEKFKSSERFQRFENFTRYKRLNRSAGSTISKKSRRFKRSERSTSLTKASSNDFDNFWQKRPELFELIYVFYYGHCTTISETSWLLQKNILALFISFSAAFSLVIRNPLFVICKDRRQGRQKDSG